MTTIYKAGSKEDLFWQMVQDLEKLTKEQSDRLFEKMWVLDLEGYMKEAK